MKLPSVYNDLCST